MTGLCTIAQGVLERIWVFNGKVRTAKLSESLYLFIFQLINILIYTDKTYLSVVSFDNLNSGTFGMLWNANRNPFDNGCFTNCLNFWCQPRWTSARALGPWELNAKNKMSVIRNHQKHSQTMSTMHVAYSNSYTWWLYAHISKKSWGGEVPSVA